MIGIITGLFLLPDGIHILSHIVQLDEALKQVMTIHKAGFLIIFIGVIRLLGGAFIVLGLLSRIMIILQIPAILAGMYIYNYPILF